MYYICGDISYPVTLEVEAKTEEEALEKVRRGEYTIFDVDMSRSLGWVNPDQTFRLERGE